MSQGARRAALALSAVGRRDRAWVFAQLGPVERQRLTEMLAELESLGLKADLDDLAAFVEEESAPPSPAATPGPRGRIERASASEIITVLQAEPDWVVAAVCSLADWPWLGAFLQHLREPRATHVRRLMAYQSALAPAAADSLLEAIVRRLDAAPAPSGFLPLVDEAADTVRPGVFRASLARLTSWLL